MRELSGIGSRLILASFVGFLSILFCASVLAMSPGVDNRAKARHFYLKGAVKDAEGKIDEAHEFYKKAYRIDPSFLEARYNYGMGRIGIAENTFTVPDSTSLSENIDFLRRMVGAYPQDVEFAENYAYYLVMADSASSALKVYRNILAKRPGLSRLYLTQSALYAMTEEMDSAINAIRAFENLEGINSETTLRKASYHLANQDTVAALNEYRLFAESAPEDLETLMNVSMAYNLLGQPEEAYGMVKEMAMKYPDNPALQFELGIIAKDYGDMEQFYKSSRDVLENEELDEETIFPFLVEFLDNLPKNEEGFAIGDDIMESLSRKYGDDIVFLGIYIRYGMIKKDYNIAYEGSRKAYTLHPDDAGLLGQAMSYAIIVEKPQDAMELYESFEGKGKDGNNILLTYITAAQTAKNYDKALAYSDTLLKKYTPELTVFDKPFDSEVIMKYDDDATKRASATYEVAAEIFTAQGKHEDTVRCYESALQLNDSNISVMNNYAYYIVETMKAKPGSPEFEKAKTMSYETLKGKDTPYYYYDTYAWILFREQDYKEALKYQEIALEMAGDEVIGELLDHYGDILFMNGQPDEALLQWEKALELEPDNEVIKKKIDTKTFHYE